MFGPFQWFVRELTFEHETVGRYRYGHYWGIEAGISIEENLNPNMYAGRVFGIVDRRAEVTDEIRESLHWVLVN
jgi:hypothetical protein